MQSRRFSNDRKRYVLALPQYGLNIRVSHDNRYDYRVSDMLNTDIRLVFHIIFKSL